ncbi:MAG: antibiotic biosynthesis monooxygenase [Actinomycetota bacterium]|jgi:quinol monooxygenase YgiN|nr:antibiotic biosynthesis monooxygenase [Actinomycetota bacterium]
MIFIVVKFTIRPDKSDDWISLTEEFTTATRQEPGNLFFEWSRSVDNPNQFVLVEAFESPEAGGVHVTTDHFKKAMAWMPDVVAENPQIIHVEVPQDGWSKMAEIQPRQTQDASAQA